jgi:hypothetical protein
MVDVVKTSTTVSLGSAEDSDGNYPVIFAGHTGKCDVFNWICYRIYPANVTEVRASVGELQSTAGSAIETKKDFLTFSNSDTASLQYPASAVLSMELNVYFDTQGQVKEAGDKNAEGKRLSLTFDPVNNQVKASEPFFGLVKCEYQTTYRVWNYAPKITESGIQRFNAGNYSVSTEFGMLAAMYKGNITTFNTSSRDSDGNGGQGTFEVYRVTSEALNNQRGAWEVHPDFPQKTWSDLGAPTENSAYMKYERVHEVGILRSGHSQLSIVQYNVRNETPKFGAANWRPKYIASFVDSQSATDTEYEHSYNTLDLEAIKADLRVRYPNITGAEAKT